MNTSPSAHRKRGFTLLEVMVSLSILALALTAVAGINANSFEESNYARFVTVATLLARSKMIDVEEQLRKDGFGSDDKELSGDFSEEGYPKMKWVASVRKVEVDVGQLVNGLFGGEVSPDSLPEQLQSVLGTLGGGSDLGELGSVFGAGAKGTGGKNVDGSQLSQLLGGGGFEMMFRQAGETLAQSIREITLEIKWGGKGTEESIQFVQYVTTSGRLAVPKGLDTLKQLQDATGGDGSNAGGQNAGGQNAGGQNAGGQNAGGSGLPQGGRPVFQLPNSNPTKGSK